MMNSMVLPSPRNPATAAPIDSMVASSRLSSRASRSQSLSGSDPTDAALPAKLSSSKPSISTARPSWGASPPTATATTRRPRSHSSGQIFSSFRGEPVSHEDLKNLPAAQAKIKTFAALKENDAMVYLEGPNVYSCGQCRTHLTSHDEIISKSFHGRHGRAYLFESCVNVTIGKAEDRFLITGLHSVCDISCKRCKTLVGWTYAKAYESSQKYKEGKFIIEKINLHIEESDSYYDVSPPAGGQYWRQSFNDGF